MTLRSLTRIVVLIVIAACVAHVRAATITSPEQAAEAFNRGLSALARSPRDAHKDLLDAAVYYRAYANDPSRLPCDRARALANLAAAALHVGDLPEAVLAARRAQLINPALPTLSTTLRESRQKLFNASVPTTDNTSTSHDDHSQTSTFQEAQHLACALVSRLPEAAWLAIALVPLLAACSLLSLRMLATNRFASVTTATIALVALPGLLILALALWAKLPTLTCTDAVVVAKGAVPVTAPELSVSSASGTVAGVILTPGVEVRIIDSRTVSGELWQQVSLVPTPGQTSSVAPFWLPAIALEPVREP